MWDGTTIATAYAGGDGTEASPYEIATGDQFAYFAEQIGQGVGTDAHYVLTDDIDLTARSWEPIGWTWNDYSAGRYFCGSLDGNGHTISYDLEVAQDMGHLTVYSNCGIGLFGISEGSFKDLSVDGTIFMNENDNSSYYGGICGLFAGTMVGCSSDVNITVGTEADITMSEIGGLVGEVQGGTVEDCLYTGRIEYSAKLTGAYIGGIAGYIRFGSIVGCKNAGDLSGGYQSSIGGIVSTGWSEDTNQILVKDCYNTGDISCDGIHAGGISARMMLEHASSVRFVNCYSTGDITGTMEDSASVCPVLKVYGSGGASYAVENCYFLTGADSHATQAASTEEIYEKLSASAEPGTWILDANGMPRLDWEFVKNATPQASFAATGEDAGTLSGLAAGMCYSVDGGDTWTEADGESAELTGVTPEHGVMVYLPGDLLATLDSDVQAISVTKAAAPEGVSGVA